MMKLSRFFLYPIIVVTLVFVTGGAAQSLGEGTEALSGKKVFFLIAEREYGTVESLPRFAKEQLEPLGVTSSFAFAKSHDRNSEWCHEFEGLDALENADVLVLSSRRRYPRSADLRRIRQWIESGKPTVAIRTSSHAFGERAKGVGYQAPKGHEAWNTFDRDTLGAKYLGHYRNLEDGSELSAQVWPEASAINHPILQGFSIGDLIPVDDKLYQYEALDPEVEVLVRGRYPKEEAIQPVAWINEKEGKRVFYTSLGTVEEMKIPAVQRLLVQVIAWGVSGQEKSPVAPLSRKKQYEADRKEGLSPSESFEMITPASGLAIDLIATEPVVAQPSFMSFDERGRMWVVQYRQYPFPAGLKLQSRDNFWRNQYTEIPAPPGDPKYVPGADRITIHEDSNGDGSFDRVTPFLEGMNMVTSLAHDKGGVWVLQPPYLLYYDDKNGDDVVDGPPQVHLRGFGIEDTHSTVNSLCWGPDGWLYGAQGSTVTASVTIEGKDAPPVKSIGQLMWRYHPVRRIYEVFSEGGGNIWSCEFDSKGRLLAGANEGRKLGYHYMQGSYNRKNFSKHGALSNSYAFGYFNGIEEPTSQRVTTNLMVYEEGALPARYEDAILTANPLVGGVFASRKHWIGPSFHSNYIDTMFHSEDRWVRPVYLATGPDGAVYVADWYDQQVNHYRNSEGRISPADGRIFRIRSEDSQPGVPVNLDQLSSDALVDLLSDKRRWYRETARRLLKERQDRSVLPRLENLVRNGSGQTALEALWVLNLMDGLNGRLRIAALDHADPWVRVWAIRLIGDEKSARKQEISRMITLAAKDAHVEVRQQLASTAQRLPAEDAIRIVSALLKRDEDASDPYMPLMVWWALEKACANDPVAVVDLFRDASLFDHPMTLNPILGNTVRRLASDGRRNSLNHCTALLSLAPNRESREVLVAGFEAAFRGRSMQGLPDKLVEELARSGGGSLALRIRQGDVAALREARERLNGASGIEEEERRRIIEALGEVPQRSHLNVLLDQLDRTDEATIMVTLAALQSYNDHSVGSAVAERYPLYSDKIQTAAQTLLASRASWSIEWVEAIAEGRISPDSIPDYAVASLRRHKDARLNRLLDKLWPEAIASSQVDEQEIERIRSILSKDTSEGDRYAGRDLYLGRCAACHSLHSEGGDIGPELTGYQRQDLDSLLLAVSSPNAEIREGYENYVVRTKDGQTITGFLADQDENVVVIRPIGGQKIVLERSKISAMENAGVSLMPSGLLAGLEDKGIVDIFAYLRSTQPLNVRLP